MSFPFEVREVPGEQALDALKSLTIPGRVSPVVLGGPDDVDRVMENHEFYDESPEELLQAALEIDTPAWLQERGESRRSDRPEFRGDWPAVAKPSTFSGHLDLLTGKPLPEVSIALLPAAAAWEVPCLLKFGGWNECPEPAEHAAMFRQWDEKYGIQVLSMSGDTIEVSVQRPPATREEALALAWEQFVYCPDIVTQGTRTVDALAASLLDGPVWIFWWD